MSKIIDTTIPIAMTIAGSDSGGGAGIQADLKTFAALGVYGTSALTSVTAQNTTDVSGVYDLPPDFIELQIETIATDIRVDAVKTGMLSSPEITHAVARAITKHGFEKVVVDPVMISKSGHALLAPHARKTIAETVLPLALVVTPNLHEAEALAGFPVPDKKAMKEAARAIFDMGPENVVVKGGHLDQSPCDILFDGRDFHEFNGLRYQTKNTHGTGCTFSSAITACLAQGQSVTDSVAHAKQFISQAIKHSFPIGHGHGPTHHFHAFYGFK